MKKKPQAKFSVPPDVHVELLSQGFALTKQDRDNATYEKETDTLTINRLGFCYREILLATAPNGNVMRYLGKGVVNNAEKLRTALIDLGVLHEAKALNEESRLSLLASISLN